MPCRGVLFTIDADQVQGLLAVAAAATSDFEVAEYAEEQGGAQTYLDKAWYGMGCCLRHLPRQVGPDGDVPFHGDCVLGGRPLTTGQHYIVTLWEPAQVVTGVAWMQEITRASWRRAYHGLFDEELVDYPEHGDEQDFEYVWHYFEAARECCVRAAAAGRAVVFLVDQ